MEYLNVTPYLGIYKKVKQLNPGEQIVYILRHPRTGTLMDTCYDSIQQAQSAQREIENDPDFKGHASDFEIVANLDATAAALIDEIEALDEIIKHPFLNGLEPVSVPFRPFRVEWDGTLKEVQRDGHPVLVGGLKIV